MKGLAMLCLFACLVFVATLSFGGEAVDLRQPECRVTTSSVLNNQSRYKGENVLDNNLETAWVEGAAKNGIGEWIQIQFAQPWDVAHVGIIPGYARRGYREDAPFEPSKDLFFANNRIRSATLYLNESIEKQIEFYDFRHMMQYFVLPNIPLKTFKLRIDEIYPGSRWDDTCISEIRFLERETEGEKALLTAEDAVPFEGEVHTFQEYIRPLKWLEAIDWLEARGIVKGTGEKKEYGTEQVVYQIDGKKLYQYKKELLESHIYPNVLEVLTRAAIAFNDKEIVWFILYSSAPEGGWLGWQKEWERERLRWLALGKIAYAIPGAFSEVFSEQPAVYTTFTVQSESLDIEYLNAQLESYLFELERVGASEEVKEMIKRSGIGRSWWASVGGNIHFLEWLETKGIVTQTGKKRDERANELLVYQMGLKKAHQYKKELFAQFKMVGGDAATNILYGLIRAAIAFNDKEIVRFFIYLPGPDAAGATNKSDILRQIKDAIPITFLKVLFEQPKDVQKVTIERQFEPPVEEPFSKKRAKIRIDRKFSKEDLVLIKRYNALVDEVHGALVDELYGE